MRPSRPYHAGFRVIMSANLIEKASFVPTPANGLGKALYFPAGDHRLFGWLNLPSSGQGSNIGLVICKPFGYEALCAHRSMRIFAEMAASEGIPALRFDYAGTGDSADVDPECNQVQTWTGDIIAAVAELRRLTGVEHVCVLGFRVGALLAASAALKSNTIDELILVAPVVAGRRYVGELRITRMAGALGAANQNGGAGTRGGAMEVSGHELTAATLAELKDVDLAAASCPPVTRMLVIDRPDLPTARNWSDSLATRGMSIEYKRLPGFVEMMTLAPHFARVPLEMLSTVRQWLRQSPHLQPLRCGNAELPPQELALPGEGLGADAMVKERPVFFGAEADLFGIVTEPRGGELRRRAVILVNAAADNHTGAARLYVSLARRWARRGYIVLRMDFAGIGDSATRASRPNDDVFPPTALDDMRMAIDFMRNRYGVGEVTLAGLCSGGYHALRAAVAALPVNRIFLVNPQNFFWTEGDSLEGLQLYEVVHNPGLYKQRMFSLAAWRRMISGQVNLWRIVKIYTQRPMLVLESSLRNVARRLRIRLPNDLGWELQEVAARGIQTTMVFARGEPGLELLRIQGGSAVRRLGDKCRVHILDAGDHTFSHNGPRSVLEDVLSRELFSRSGDTPGAAKENNNL
jgi:alpha-beta hydrolase superfamily lysophospholipase